MSDDARVREIALLVMNVRRRRNGLDDLDWSRMEALKSHDGVQYALDLARAIAALPPHVPHVPDGWKLVPVEPSRDQYQAGLTAANGVVSYAVIGPIYRAMLSASPSPPQDGWRPIEEAPKDGTEIIGGWLYPFQRQTGTPLAWQKIPGGREGWFMLSPQGENHDGTWTPTPWLNSRNYPTHWMPLPAAPQVKP